MKLSIPLKPLSVNVAFQGRRFKTPAYKQYEKDITKLLGRAREKPIEGELYVCYSFYLKNYALTDTGNLEKLLTDTLVALGYIKDDRYIKKLVMEKYRAKQDSIEVKIYPFDASFGIF